MSCKVRTNNGFHYVRFNNGTPYIYCGADSTLPPEEIPIDQNFFIVLIDEADPIYAYDNGASIGPFWEKDLQTLSDTSINTDAVTVFDIGNRPEQIGKTIAPLVSTYGEGMPWSNILTPSQMVDTTRPTPNDSISQDNFYAFVKSSIENIWGTNFWTRFAASGYKLVIIVDVSGSLTRTIIGGGLDSFESFLTSQGIVYQEYNACSNERWLKWIEEIYSNPSITGIAPCGCESTTPYCAPAIRDYLYNSSNYLTASTCMTNKEDWIGQTGVQPLFNTVGTTNRVLHLPYYQYGIDYADITRLNISYENFLASKKIKITVDDPIFSGVYVFDEGYIDNSIDHQPPLTLFYGVSQYSLNITESTLNPALLYYDSSLIGYNLDAEYNNKYIVSLDFVLNSNFDRVPGLLETQITHDTINSGIVLNDAYSYPGAFIFTAIKAPNDVDGAYVKSVTRESDLYNNNGNSDIPYPFVSGIGHRYVATFALPAQYRYSYKDYVLMDWISHNINSTEETININNHVFDIDSTILEMPNFFFANYPVYDFTIGISGIRTSSSNFPAPDDFFRYISTQATNVVTQQNRIIESSGVAYRVSATGIPFIHYYGGFSPADGLNWTRAGLGRDQLFTNVIGTYYDNNENIDVLVTTHDTRPLFGPKIPSSATLEFVNRCENINCNIDISNIQSVNPTGMIEYYYSVDGLIDCQINTTNIRSFIATDYLCVNSIPLPTLQDFQSFGVTGTASGTYNIAFFSPQWSGGNMYGGIYPATGILPYPYDRSVFFTGFDFEQDTIIGIPYNGPQTPSGVRQFITDNILPVAVNSGNRVVLPSDLWFLQDRYSIQEVYPSVDLLWNINNDSTVTALVVPNSKPYYTINNAPIVKVHSNIPDFSGTYTYFSDGYTSSILANTYPVYAKNSNHEYQFRIMTDGWTLGVVTSGNCYMPYYKLITEFPWQVSYQNIPPVTNIVHSGSYAPSWKLPLYENLPFFDNAHWELYPTGVLRDNITTSYL